MIPIQPTKSSRRSSILKIPRSRSSLTHNGDPNTSAVDDSPSATMKLKRRVSFAEKKHVKEFCDSIEQGTVWDNTYEESDSSQMRTNQSDKFTEVSQLSHTNGYQVQISSNIEVHSSITVTNKSLSLSSVPKLVCQSNIDCEPLPLGVINDSRKIRQSTILNSPSFLVNKENIPEVLKLSIADSSLVDDEEIVGCPRKSLPASPYPKFSVYCDDETEKNDVDHLNCSNYENVSMECTVLAGNSSSPECSSNDVDKHESEHCKNNVFDDNRELGKTDMRPETTVVFHDKSMDITEAIPRTRFSVRPNITNDEKTQFFYDKSMEITEVVPNIRFTFKPNDINDDKTEYFQNKSMEITEAISQIKYPLPSSCLKDNNTKFFNDKFVETTETPSNEKFSCKPKCLQIENNRISQNNLIKINEASLNVQCSTVPNHLDDEKTTVFHNKSMEMTEAISNMKCPTVPHHFTQEKTPHFLEDSLEMTGVIPFNRFPSLKPSTTNDDKTTVFHDKSMEMTEVVPNAKYFSTSRCTDEEKTQFFHDKSMEITKPVLSLKNPSSCVDNEDKTTMFHNQSMEMTEAITSLKRIINQINSSNNVLPKNTPNNNRSTNSTLRSEVDHNYFMEFTEAIQSIKRPYNLIENANKSSELSSPMVKNPRYSGVSEQRKPISEEDLEKLHQLLRQDLSKINSLSQTEVLQDNHCTSVTNVISDQQPTCDDNDAMEMTEVIPPIQLAKLCMDESLSINHIVPVEVPHSVEEVDPSNSTLTAHINEPNELLNNCDNSHTSTENESSKENQSSAIITSSQSETNNIVTQSKVVESTSWNPSCNNTLEAPNLLEVFNKVVRETPIIPRNNNVSIEKSRFQSTFNNAQSENDVTYDLTQLIIQNKETEKTFLEYEEAPSFMYDQNLSDQYLKKNENNRLLDEPPMPDMSLTEVFTPVEEDNLNENQITNIPSEQKTSNITEKEDDIETNHCQTFHENKEEIINRRGTFVVKKHHDITDIVEPTTQSEVESTEGRMIDQSNDDNAVFDTVNKVNAITSSNREEYEEFANEMNNREITEEQLICRPPIETDLLDVDHESHVNNNQLISTNIVSKRRGKEFVKDVIKKVKTHEDESVFLENDAIIKKIVQTTKEYAERRNKIKCMVKLGINTTDKVDAQKPLDNVNELVTDLDDDKSPYEVLEEGLRMYEEDDKCLWKIYAINREVICIDFYKTALLLLIKLNVPDTSDEYERITNVRIISRLNDGELAILKIIDNLIIQRINTQSLVEEYKTYEDVPKLVDHVTNEIKVVYDFYDDLEKLNRKYVINITDDNKISLVLRSQNMSKIIRLSIRLNFFTKIHSEDFKSISLLGSNIQNHVEQLAKSIKPGPNFLSAYIKQVEQLLNVY